MLPGHAVSCQFHQKGKVHDGAMWTASQTIRQSVSLPATVAAQVRSMARTRRLSANRMLVELIENGIEAEKRKQREFFELAERFRDATDPEEAKRLGDRLGRIRFQKVHDVAESHDQQAGGRDPANFGVS